MTPTLANIVQPVIALARSAPRRARWRAGLGTALAIAVALFALTGGSALGQSTTPSLPAADNFASATELKGSLPIDVTGSNKGFTKQAGEPNHAGNAAAASAWYRWTAADTAPVVI